jgi:endonuclease G
MTQTPRNTKEPYRSLTRDRAVFDALRERFAAGREVPGVGNLESMGVSVGQFQEMMDSGPAEGAPLNALEAIILLTGRPALLIQDNDFLPPELDEIRLRLEPQRALLKTLIPSVARLDVVALNNRYHMGTAWMLEEDVMITNRHVASVFARERAGEYLFRRLPSGLPYEADVDFYREYRRDTTFSVRIEQVLYIEPDQENSPDMALVRVQRDERLPAPLIIAGDVPEPDEDVVTIGYPGDAPRNNNPSALEDYFDGIYGVKRLSPGRVSRVESGQAVFNHDCTTLGGNSGSCVVRLATGEVLGLHFAGVAEENNWAVSAATLRQRLQAVRRRVISLPPAAPGDLSSSMSSPGRVRPAPGTAPLQPEAPRVTAEELRSRSGYDTEFLRERVQLPRPTGELVAQVVPVDDKPDGILDYTHYSVVMHRARRLAMFTACNIDGGRAYRIPRAAEPWQTDPRIPDEVQADNRLYTSNTLDRGHLVRRLDTAWGENRAEAAAAELDTFFYTNAAPQHQRLNRQLWLGLEDYVLGNADNHDLRVTVFTGPVFRATDRQYRGFTIPEDFWKVLVFSSGNAGRVSATGYLLTQTEFLAELEFVYGPYETYQVPIVDIEALTSLDFHFLRNRDPLGADERLEGAPRRGRKLQTVDDLLL